MEKIHWKKVFNSNYLGACDLEEGKDLSVIIKSVTIQEVKNTDGKKQNRNVAEFTDPAIKPMILNVTNCRIIKKFANSTYINDWVNIPVVIYIKPDIKAFGDITEGLRIRETKAKVKAKLLPDTEEWRKALDYLKGDGAIDKIKLKYDLTEQNEETLKNAVLS